MTTYCSDKDVNKLIKCLIKEGWVFTRGKKHGKLTSDMSAEPIIISSSPALLNKNAVQGMSLISEEGNY